MSVITHTLDSGYVLSVSRSASFGEIVITTLVLVLIGILVLHLLVSIRRRKSTNVDR